MGDSCRHGRLDGCSVASTRALLCLVLIFFAAGLPGVSAVRAQEAPAIAGETERSLAAEERRHEWFVEPETGKRYRLQEIRKSLAPFEIVEGNRVRFLGGAEFPIVAESDELFLVKVYESARPSAEPEEDVDPEIEASYRVATQEADRVRFQAFDAGLPSSGQWRNGFDIADVDGDGHLDIVFGPARKGAARPNVFLGDGRGSWRRLPAAGFPSLAYDYGAAVAADFDGDGLTDIALAMHLLGAVVLANRGEGRFEPWSEGIELGRPTEGNPQAAFSSRALAASDWNGDGRPDLVLMAEGPRRPGPVAADGGSQPARDVRGIRVYLNQGDGSWQAVAASQSEAQRRNFADSIAVDDLDRDGDLDVVTGTRQLGNRWLVGSREPDGSLRFDEVVGLRQRGLVLGVAIDDVDADGWPDIVVAYQSNEGAWRTGVDILWGGESRWSRQGVVSRQTRRGVMAVATGDVDGDGLTDIVAADQNAEVLVFLGAGDRGFLRERSQPGELPESRPGCAGYAVRLRDLDGDGRDEIVAAFAGERDGLGVLTGNSAAGCPGGGSLRVWKAEPVTVEDAPRTTGATNDSRR